jgi:hypothetical protein
MRRRWRDWWPAIAVVVCIAIVVVLCLAGSSSSGAALRTLRTPALPREATNGIDVLGPSTHADPGGRLMSAEIPRACR